MSMTFRRLVALLAVVLLPLAVQADETTTYYVNDLLGSPVAAMDDQGNVLWTETYAPYGARIEESRANSGNPAYTGKPEDPVTGLVYMGERWYDPETGRFTSVDPVRFVDSNIHSFNRYAYANNSPYVFVDPDGSYAELIVEGASLAIGLASFYANIKAGSYGDAAIDAVVLVIDAAMVAVPIAPGVAGLGIKASREAGQVANTADKFSRAPKGLMDQMVLDAAKQGKGTKIMENLNDPKFKGMEKWSYTEKSASGLRSEVHYVRDPKTGELRRR